MTSLLDLLRQTSHVDCDTLDNDVTKELGPFVDCTSNQAIAYLELTRPVAGQAQLLHDILIKSTIVDARGRLSSLQAGAPFADFVIEILMIKLQLLMAPDVTGYVHVQTNPKLSYSTRETLKNARRIVAIFEALAPQLGAKRICIKIPSSWEGLQACRELEASGIATLATTLFCMEQATLAAHVGCTYIAPYVNELRVHFDKGFVDENKAFDLCREAQAYYLANGFKTRVLAASLTSVDEVMQLAGIQHVTVSPGLLRQLAARDASSWTEKVGAYFAQGPKQRSWETLDYNALFGDDGAWRLAFARHRFGASEGKLVQAINYFCDFQDKLEELVARYA